MAVAAPRVGLLALGQPKGRLAGWSLEGVSHSVSFAF